MNIVLVLPHSTQLLNMQVQTKSVSLAKWGTRSILQQIHPKTHMFLTTIIIT